VDFEKYDCEKRAKCPPDILKLPTRATFLMLEYGYPSSSGHFQEEFSVTSHVTFAIPILFFEPNSSALGRQRALPRLLNMLASTTGMS
jgi:hypothetical protein